MAPYGWPQAKPGSGGGPKQNAKAQSTVKQSYGKGTSAKQYPAKKPGATNDSPRSRKGSPLASKRKK